MSVFAATAKVTIHFIGIAMFSSQIPNDPGQHVIVPRIAYSSPQLERNTFAAANSFEHYSIDLHNVHYDDGTVPVLPPVQPPPVTKKPAPATKPPVPLASNLNLIRIGKGLEFPHVEDHMAAIVFPTQEYDATSTWPKTDFQDQKPSSPYARYSFVILNKDRVSFVTNANNVASDLNGLALPHLQKDAECCPSMTALNSHFLKPYDGAAAVFDIPQGKLGTCSTDFSTSERLDTELVLDSAPVFVIRSGTKELRLKPISGAKVDVFVVNLPRRYVLYGDHTVIPSTSMAGLNHSLAYYAMGNDAAAACTKPLADWWNAKHPFVNTCTLPDYTTQPIQQVQLVASGGPRAMSTTSAPPTANKTVAVNFECSNSQWP